MRKCSIRKMLFASVSAAVLVGFALTDAIAFAQEAQPPQTATQNGVTYLSGGIGEDEISAIRAMSPKFNLHLLFAAKNGMYLSDVDVVVISSSGDRIITLTSDGPLLFVRLAPGRYYVSATSDQTVLHRWITVPERGAVSINFYWR